MTVSPPPPELGMVLEGSPRELWKFGSRIKGFTANDFQVGLNFIAPPVSENLQQLFDPFPVNPIPSNSV